MLDRRMGRVLECVTCGPRYIKIKIVGPWFESECLFVCRQESLQSEPRFLCVHNNLSNLVMRVNPSEESYFPRLAG